MILGLLRKSSDPRFAQQNPRMVRIRTLRITYISAKFRKVTKTRSKFGQDGKLGHSCTNVTKAKPYDSRVSYHAIVRLGLDVGSSAHNCGCVVDGGSAMAAI